MNKLNIYLFLLLLLPIMAFSESAFDQGKTLFSQNNVEEATYLFEEALITAPTVDTYRYLAECYNILGMHEDETLVLEEAISESATDLSYFYFKLGNANHLIGNYKDALDSYLQVLTLKDMYVNEAFLNIANVSVELKLYSGAIDNYSKYLELEPNSIQKRKIIKMIFLLKRAYKDEQASLKAELLVQEEEDKLLEEQRLLDELDQQQSDEERLNDLTASQELEAEMDLKARELEEQRLLFDEEEQSLLEDRKQFEIDEEKVVNPPDADIEAQREVLRLREEDLNNREEKLRLAELDLENRRNEIATNPNINTESIVPREKTAEELEQEELLRLEAEEKIRQEALMSDILQSLEQIGENAKGINANSEEAYNELEGSGIDE